MLLSTFRTAVSIMMSSGKMTADPVADWQRSGSPEVAVCLAIIEEDLESMSVPPG